MSRVTFKIVSQGTPDHAAATALLAQNMPCISGPSEKFNEQIHMSAFDENELIATAVLVIEDSGCKIQQIVVKKNMRNEGVGSEILKYLEDYAWLNGDKYIYSIPNDMAFLFFDKNGYQIEGNSLEENGVSFIKVYKSLQERYPTDYFTKTTLREVYRLILEGCLSYRERFIFLEKDSCYQIAADFADFIVESYDQNKKEILKSFVHLMHNLVTHEDDKVSELAVIGILENIQGKLGITPEKYLEFSKILTSEVRLWWSSLDKFWNKEIPYVGHDISTK